MKRVLFAVVLLCAGLFVSASFGDELSPLYPPVPNPVPLPVKSGNRDVAAAFAHDAAVALATWEMNQTSEARIAWLLLSEIPRAPGVPEFERLEAMMMAAEVRLIDAQSNISAVMLDLQTIEHALRDYYLWCDIGLGDSDLAWWSLEVATYGSMAYVGGAPRTIAAEVAINTVLDDDIIACWVAYWDVIDSGFWGTGL